MKDKKLDMQVFPTDDIRLKTLGEIFSNESGRKILSLLLEKESTIMEISKECRISANLVIHHIKKMIITDIVIVTKETTNSRGRSLRFYRAKPAIVILPKDAATKLHKNNTLRKTLDKIVRFGSVGLAGIITWIFTSSPQYVLESTKYPRPTLPPYMTPIEHQSSVEPTLAILMTASVVAAGFLINYIIKRIKNKHKPSELISDGINHSIIP